MLRWPWFSHNCRFAKLLIVVIVTLTSFKRDEVTEKEEYPFLAAIITVWATSSRTMSTTHAPIGYSKIALRMANVGLNSSDAMVMCPVQAQFCFSGPYSRLSKLTIFLIQSGLCYNHLLSASSWLVDPPTYSHISKKYPEVGSSLIGTEPKVINF